MSAKTLKRAQEEEERRIDQLMRADLAHVKQYGPRYRAPEEWIPHEVRQARAALVAVLQAHTV